MWLWIIAAPASIQARASAVISDGSTGTWGLVAFDVTPLMAHSMMTGLMQQSSTRERGGESEPAGRQRARCARWNGGPDRSHRRNADVAGAERRPWVRLALIGPQRRGALG